MMIASLVRRVLAIRQRIRSLATSVDILDAMLSEQPSTRSAMDEIKRTRLLFSFDRNMKTHHVRVTGTQAQIEAAAQRLARRTKSCVMVAVIVANYHTRGCEEHPRGGYREDGD
jgi:hypothetical protein